MQRRNGHRFAAVEANQCGIDQITHFHDFAQGVDVDTGAVPNLRAGGCGQYGLHINTLRRKFQAQALGQKQHKRLGRPIDRHTELRCQTHHRTDVDDGAFTCFGKAWRDGAGEPHQRGGVEGHQLRNAVGALLDEGA
ncbi:hypothetical protein D3C75_890110 [compost metagenome]